MTIEVKIPIKSYLKKYILKKSNAENPFTVSKNYILGKMVIKTFSQNNNKPKKTSDFTDSLDIVFDHEYDLNLSAGNVNDFNILLEDIYRKDLAMFIGLDRLFNIYPERKQAILNFNSAFGITEEEIAVETLIKYVQRHTEDTQIFECQSYKKLL